MESLYTFRGKKKKKNIYTKNNFRNKFYINKKYQ